MSKQRSPNRDKAFKLYKKNKGNITPKELAQLLNESAANIRTWKNADKWNEQLGIVKRKKGGQKGNINGLKHGLYVDESKFSNAEFLKKYLPKSTHTIMQGIEQSGMKSLDILWSNIIIKYTAIIRSQNIMYVDNHNDLTKELKKSKVKSTNKETEKATTNSTEEQFEYDLQYAWDKQERFLKAQSIAMGTLTKMIKEYEDLLHKNWDNASEEQKLRVEKLKQDISTLKDNEIDTNLNINIKVVE